jgi:hypothetical protein
MSLKEFYDRITHALQTITADMLQRVCDEFDYRVDRSSLENQSQKTKKRHREILLCE